jgi:hypothetical protein
MGVATGQRCSGRLDGSDAGNPRDRLRWGGDSDSDWNRCRWCGRGRCRRGGCAATGSVFSGTFSAITAGVEKRERGSRWWLRRIRLCVRLTEKEAAPGRGEQGQNSANEQRRFAFGRFVIGQGVGAGSGERALVGASALAAVNFAGCDTGLPGGRTGPGAGVLTWGMHG